MVDDKVCLVVMVACLKFTIGNPKYLRGPKGPGGSKLPLLGSTG